MSSFRNYGDVVKAELEGEEFKAAARAITRPAGTNYAVPAPQHITDYANTVMEGLGAVNGGKAYYSKNPDGKFGEGLQKAIAAYKKDNPIFSGVATPNLTTGTQEKRAESAEAWIRNMDNAAAINGLRASEAYDRMLSSQKELTLKEKTELARLDGIVKQSADWLGRSDQIKAASQSATSTGYNVSSGGVHHDYFRQMRESQKKSNPSAVAPSLERQGGIVAPYSEQTFALPQNSAGSAPARSEGMGRPVKYGEFVTDND